MTQTFAKETITRQQAARAEIDTAIDLLFADGSPVAIEVLTWAAVEMMRGVAEHRGVETFQATLERRIKPDALKMWRELLKGHYNFFKHGDRDPERTTDDFMPEAITFPLFGACADYQKIYSKITFPMMSYVGWFMARHPGLMMPEFEGQSAALAKHLGHPEGKSFRRSLREVSKLYQDGKKNISLLKDQLDQLGDRFEP